MPDPHRFGIATLDADGNVVQLIEKPADPPSDLAWSASTFFTPRIHDAVAAIEPSPRANSRSPTRSNAVLDAGERVRANCSTDGGSTPAS
ncbi:MAG: sugar phosphate nucleotidyltransferase [Ilumatobacteraceae bacterium]